MAILIQFCDRKKLSGITIFYFLLTQLCFYLSELFHESFVKLAESLHHLLQLLTRGQNRGPTLGVEIFEGQNLMQ